MWEQTKVALLIWFSWYKGCKRVVLKFKGVLTSALFLQVLSSCESVRSFEKIKTLCLICIQTTVLLCNLQNSRNKSCFCRKWEKCWYSLVLWALSLNLTVCQPCARRFTTCLVTWQLMFIHLLDSRIQLGRWRVKVLITNRTRWERW